METWKIITIVCAAFELGILIGAWWASLDYYQERDTAQFLMDGKL